VPVGRAINLTLSNVNLEFHSNCTFDYLQVRNVRCHGTPPHNSLSAFSI